MRFTLRVYEHVYFPCSTHILMYTCILYNYNNNNEENHKEDEWTKWERERRKIVGFVWNG